MNTHYRKGLFTNIDPAAQIIFIDDYCISSIDSTKLDKIPIVDLVKICDGTYEYRETQKMKRKLLEYKDTIVVIFSNNPPSQVYTFWNRIEYRPDIEGMRFIDTRFNVVEIGASTHANELALGNSVGVGQEELSIVTMPAHVEPIAANGFVYPAADQ